jgi:hypothetical protein
MDRSQFSINDGQTYHDGFTNGTLWNGWACPSFEYNVCVDIMNEINALSEAYQSGESIFYDPQHDAFVYKQDNEIWDTYNATAIKFEGETIKVYSLGAFGWVWWDKSWDNE